MNFEFFPYDLAGWASSAFTSPPAPGSPSSPSGTTENHRKVLRTVFYSFSKVTSKAKAPKVGTLKLGFHTNCYLKKQGKEYD